MLMLRLNINRIDITTGKLLTLLGTNQATEHLLCCLFGSHLVVLKARKKSFHPFTVKLKLSPNLDA